MNDIIEIGKIMRPRSLSKEFQGTVLEMLGTAQSVGCTIDGEDPHDVIEAIKDGTYDGPGHLRVRLPWTALYGQLSGYLDCARRAPALGLPLVSIATAGEFTSLRTESGDVDVEAPARVYAATDSALVHAAHRRELTRAANSSGDRGDGALCVV